MKKYKFVTTSLPWFHGHWEGFFRSLMVQGQGCFSLLTHSAFSKLSHKSTFSHIWCHQLIINIRPRGKEGTKVQITQNKGKERENLPKIEEITIGKAHANTQKLNRNILMVTAVFLNQKRVNVCKHTTKMRSLESFWKVPPGDCKRNGWWEI